MRILFCIFTCSKYQQRQEALKNSWLKGNDFIFLSDKDSDNSVCLSEIDGHKSCELRQISSIDWLVKNRPNYDWYFFSDDDTFVNTKNLFALKLNSEICYGKVLSRNSDRQNPCWPKYPNLTSYLSGGAGFMISSRNMENLSALNKVKFRTGYSDLTLGIFIQMKNLILENLEGFHSDNPENLFHSDGNIMESITYHYVTPDNMLKIYEKLSSHPN